MTIATHAEHAQSHVFAQHVLNAIRKIHMDSMEMYMHALASPDARKVASVKDMGQIRIALIPWKWMICSVALAVLMLPRKS